MLSRLSTCILAILAFAGSSWVNAATIEMAQSNYVNGKFDLALAQFRELSLLGNKEAQFNVGVMHIRGEGVERDYASGYAWLSLSLTGGPDLENRKKMGEKVSSHLSEEQRLRAEQVIVELEKTYGEGAVAERIAPKLSRATNSGFLRSEIVRTTSAKYPKVELQQGRLGTVVVQYIVGADGRVKYPFVLRGVGDNFRDASLKAIKSDVFMPAEVNGQNVESYTKKRHYSFEISGGEPDTKKIEHHLDKLKEKSESGSSLYKYLYASSISVLKRYLAEETQQILVNPNSLYFEAAVDGLSLAKFQLGNSLMYGEQCYSDFDKSYFWLQSAAQDGLLEAQMMMGLERLNGVRYAKNTEEGLAWLKTAAEKYEPAKIEYAKAVMAYQKNADLERLASDLNSINYKNFEDKISLLEAKILVQKKLGNQKEADELLKQLKKQSKKLKLPFEQLASNIDRLLAGESVTPLKV